MAKSRRAAEATAVADVLLEIGTEEIPARFLPAIRQQLRNVANITLMEHALLSGSEETETYATPRRMVILVKGVRARQEDRAVEVLGPLRTQAFGPDGKATPAAEGFARKHGVAVVDLKDKATEKGVRLAYVAVKKGQPAAAVLPQALAEVIDGLEFPKSMRWPQSPVSFARPIRWLLAMYGNRPLKMEAAGLTSGTTTRGLRFVHPKPLRVKSASNYFEVIRKAGIVLKVEDRRSLIDREANRLAEEAGGVVLVDDGLLDEVADLVEKPEVLLGTFPRELLDLPKCVVVAAMREHQRYFSVVARMKETLLPNFIVVANGVNTKAVAAGNERVLKARLADAGYFFREDRKKRLDEFLPTLAGVIWQAKAGTMRDKAERIEALAGWVAEHKAVGADVATARRAGLLAKADLVTKMVFEFPSLQGAVGGVYADADGETEVGKAIFDHYRPQGPRDSVHPGIAAVVALADKADTLIGHLALGHAPSGTADPYGLRRAALGIIRIVRERGWRINLSDLCARGERAISGTVSVDGVRDKFMQFLKERAVRLFEQEGYAHDEVRAGMVDFGDVVLAEDRMKALQKLRSDPEFREVVFALSRITNILPKEYASVLVSPEWFLETALYTEEELFLYEAHQIVHDRFPGVDSLQEKGQIERLFKDLSDLKPAIDHFFEKVLVMDKDEAVRTRRLRLLQYVAGTIRLFADVKQLVIS